MICDCWFLDYIASSFSKFDFLSFPDDLYLTEPTYYYPDIRVGEELVSIAGYQNIQKYHKKLVENGLNSLLLCAYWFSLLFVLDFILYVLWCPAAFSHDVFASFNSTFANVNSFFTDFIFIRLYVLLGLLCLLAAYLFFHLCRKFCYHMDYNYGYVNSTKLWKTTKWLIFSNLLIHITMFTTWCIWISASNSIQSDFTNAWVTRDNNYKVFVQDNLNCCGLNVYNATNIGLESAGSPCPEVYSYRSCSKGGCVTTYVNNVPCMNQIHGRFSFVSSCSLLIPILLLSIIVILNSKARLRAITLYHEVHTQRRFIFDKSSYFESFVSSYYFPPENENPLEGLEVVENN